MTKRISTADFRAFVRTKEKETLLTEARKAKFMVQVKENAIKYTVLSTMKTRPHETPTMEKVLEKFYLTGSYKTVLIISKLRSAPLIRWLSLGSIWLTKPNNSENFSTRYDPRNDN